MLEWQEIANFLKVLFILLIFLIPYLNIDFVENLNILFNQLSDILGQKKAKKGPNLIKIQKIVKY